MYSIALLGGGQLGKMLIQAGLDLDVSFHVLDPDAEAPCRYISRQFVTGALTDFDTVAHFLTDKKLVTYEIEHIHTAALEQAEAQGALVMPSAAILKMVQNKILQKEFYKTNHLPTANFEVINNNNEITHSKLQFPVFYKLATGGYDGRGVKRIADRLEAASGFDKPGIIEEAANIEKELAVMVARNRRGEVKVYPLVEMVFNPQSHMVDYLLSPAQVPEHIAQQATKLAAHLAQLLDLVGILAVELFYTREGELLINEIAPRPHNSMHHSIEANATSQFQQLLRILLDLPLGNTELKYPFAAMLNLVGEPGHTGRAQYVGLAEVLQLPDTWVHLYGKAYTRPNRKMGHITTAANDLETLLQRIYQIKNTVKVIAKH